MQIKTARASCLLRLISFFLFGAMCFFGGFYLGMHKERILGFLQKNYPAIQAAVEKRVSQLQQGRGPQIIDIQPAEKQKSSRPAQTPMPLPNKVKKIRISSFNISNFSNSNNSDNLILMAQILKYSDIVAIQGLKEEDTLKKTVGVLRKLGHNYSYDISPPVGRGIQERYAFLYRPDKVTMIQKGKLYQEKKTLFFRDPFYTSFQAGNFDFTLVTVHIPASGDSERQISEITALAEVYDALQKAAPLEQDIIILGTFNLPPDDSSWKNLQRFPTMTCLIRPPETTTITDSLLGDNLWFQKKYVREYTGTSGIIRFDENIFKNDDKKAQQAISNHRPVWADFSISAPDDD